MRNIEINELLQKVGFIENDLEKAGLISEELKEIEDKLRSLKTDNAGKQHNNYKYIMREVRKFIKYLKNNEYELFYECTDVINETRASFKDIYNTYQFNLLPKKKRKKLKKINKLFTEINDNNCFLIAYEMQEIIKIK